MVFLECTSKASGKKREGKIKAATLFNNVAALLTHEKVSVLGESSGGF
jgi:hypothetical protein